MSRSIENGSMTHVRYAHSSRPAKIDVKCPRCGFLARAEKDSEKGRGAVIGDLAPSWNLSDWRVTCLSCPLRLEGLAYAELPALFYSLDGVWAWNRGHLSALLRYLRREPLPDEPYAWLMAYVPGEWKRHKASTAKLLAKLAQRPTGPTQ